MHFSHAPYGPGCDAQTLAAGVSPSMLADVMLSRFCAARSLYGWTWLAVQLPWDDVPSLGFWSQPVFPLVLARSVFFVRLLLVLRIAQWEEMKNFVSTEPSAFQKL